jgi:hypothetical protein
MSELGRPFLPPDLRRLIELGRHGGDPPIELKRNVGKRLDRTLGLGGAMLTPISLTRLGDSPSEPPPPPSIAADVFGWKTFAGAMLGALTGGAALLVVASRSPRATASSPNTDRVVEIHRNSAAEDPWLQQARSSNAFRTDAVSPSVSASPTSQPRARARATPPHRIVARRASQSLDTLAAERTVLDAARAALLRRDGSAGLAAVRSHERAFPNGQLLEERESMRVQALALAGDFAAARAARERFHRHFPRSMFLPMVEQILEANR